MKYDFDTLISRDGTNSSKWRMKNDILPMWVADMDFKAAPEILNALQKRLDNGVFGYSFIPKEWNEAIKGSLALYQRFLLLLEDLAIQEIKF